MVRASSLWKGEPCEKSVFSVRTQRVFVPSCAVLFPSGFRLFGSVFEQAGAGILQQVEHQFETFPAFIVGVRNMVVVVPAAEIRHTVNFGFVFEGKGQAVEGMSKREKSSSRTGRARCVRR